jgi:hypothetical protein
MVDYFYNNFKRAKDASARHKDLRVLLLSLASYQSFSSKMLGVRYVHVYETRAKVRTSGDPR